MNIIPGMPPPPVLSQGQNAIVEVHRALGGSVKFVIKDAKHPSGYYADLPPQTAIAAAAAMLEAAGVDMKIGGELGDVLKRLIAGAQHRPGGLILP